MESRHLPKQPLHRMFTTLPPRYDLINRIITLGLDRQWRRLAAMTCLANKPRCISDIGCGTGDLTIILARLADQDTEIFGLDYSLPMLASARAKAGRAGVDQKITLVHANATQAPFPDGFFDCVGMSFSFRNLTYKNPLRLPFINDVLRLLKQGGRLVVVESSQPANPIIRSIFHVYLRAFVAPVGICLSGNKGAYRYLADSAADFYSPSEIREMLLSQGFRRVDYRPLFFGAAGIHVAEK